MAELIRVFTHSRLTNAADLIAGVMREQEHAEMQVSRLSAANQTIKTVTNLL